LNAADLFVLASRSEGWCNAIVEALACGCPVVATDVGGNREIVTDPALGRLVPFGDRDALAGTVCEALTKEWDRAAIAEVGGRRDWQQVARECVDLFESVLDRGGRSHPRRD
jgi:glycosyltransferase involved in cell wall biosynthesis